MSLLKAFGRITGWGVLVAFGLVAGVHAALAGAERQRNCYMPLFTEVLLSGMALLVCLASATLFLNHNRWFRSHKGTVVASFVGAPLLCTLGLLIALTSEFGQGASFLYAVAALGPPWFFILRELLRFYRSGRQADA